MKLTAFRVHNYRPILDSGWVELSDITVIVGKNESGKTALFKALHKFNPFKPEPYNLDREWPRGRRTERSEDAPVVETRFALDDTEKEKLSAAIVRADTVAQVEITKTYKGDFRFRFLPQDLPNANDPAAFEGRLSEAFQGIPPTISAQLKTAIDAAHDAVATAFREGGIAEYQAKHAQFVQQIEQAIQADNPTDKQVADSLKKTISDLNRIAATPPKQQAEALIKSWLPTFIYMDDHKPFSGIAFLDQIKQRKDANALTPEDRTFLMILEMAGINFDQEHTRAMTQDKEQRMLDMNDASLSLTSNIADHWSQRKYQVRFEADGFHMIAFVSDELQPALVPLNERSKGFKWFFSFDMTFLYETKGTFKNAILLLDEPGLHLHAAAQRDLLKRMEAYAEANQLIYSTHMPFMIEMRRLDNIRVCVENKQEGTKVSSDFYAADEHARFPLQAALGLSISQSLFVGPFNLVVEGVTDFWFLSTIGAMLRDAGKASYDERIVITPSGGATKAAYVGTMLQGQQLNVVILLDSDPEGRNVADGLIKQWIMKDRHVLLLGQAIGRDGDTTIEDLFPLDFYLGYVNQAYTQELGGRPITAVEINARHEALVVQRIDGVMVARGLARNSEGLAFNKGRPAKLMLREWAPKGLSDLPPDVFGAFERLFQAINSAMPALSAESAGGDA